MQETTPNDSRAIQRSAVIDGGTVYISKHSAWFSASFDRVKFVFEDTDVRGWPVIFYACHFDCCDGLPPDIFKISRSSFFVNSVYALNLVEGTDNFIENDGKVRATPAGMVIDFGHEGTSIVSGVFDEAVDFVGDADANSKTVHLRYDLMGASMSDESRHPQVVMKELGITYQHATPQSIADMWQFWNCENLPAELPKFLTTFEADPMERIGYGLSQKDAEAIRDFKRG